MKLYTEEQVREAFKMGHEHGTNWIHPNLHHSMQRLKPIELPSDEEIENNAYTDRRVDDWEHDQQIGFELGAKWMKEQILNQNK